MKRIALLSFMLLIFSYAYAQQTVNDTRILFRGVVIATQTRERLAGSGIFLNSISYATSRSDGTFSFYANKLDTVLFTMLGFKPVRFFVSDTLKSKEFLTGVYMDSDTIAIGEVIIVPKFRNLRAEFMNPQIEQNVQMENARANITTAAYVGRTTQPKMGDPNVNYEIIRNKQMRAAYEKGGIPSDQMVAISPFMLIPAAYLLLHGLPEVPRPPEPSISQKDLDELNKLFIEKLGKH